MKLKGDNACRALSALTDRVSTQFILGFYHLSWCWSHRAISLLPLGAETWDFWVLIVRPSSIRGEYGEGFTILSFPLTFSYWGLKFKMEYYQFMGFPDDSVGKYLPANAGDADSILRLGWSPGEGNPLQCSCLENPMDRGAWQDIVHRVVQSWTWLKWLSTHTLNA